MFSKKIFFALDFFLNDIKCFQNFFALDFLFLNDIKCFQ